MTVFTKENTEIIIGNPGCGKTTELIRRVADLLESGVKPSAIAYCSFSVAAIEEAIARATIKCDLKKESFPWFRTLHSMAFQMLGLNTQQTMQDYHLRDFGSMMNMSFTSVDKSKIKNTGFVTKDDKMIQLINVSRLYDKPIRDYMIDISCEDFSVERVEEVAELYKRFKLANGIFDYTDMLLLAKNTELDIPDFEHLFIDEAQDLSTLQWILAKKMAEKSKHITIAGDDKQCINEFAGADVDSFLNIDGKVTVLEQSYRVPKRVYNMANRVMTQMSKYREEGTKWKPREEDGVLRFCSWLPVRDMMDGEWMILARTNGQLTEIAKKLINAASDVALVFTINNQPPIDVDVFRAIKLFEIDKTPSGRTKEDLVIFKEEDSEEDRKKKLEYILLFKKFIDNGKASGTQPWELTEQFMEAFNQKSWLNAFNKLGIGERRYINYLKPKYEEEGMEIFKFAPIKLLTIHSAKGTEADNVVVVTNVSRSVAETIAKKESDTEVKVFYVAVTRAKKRLFLMTNDERKVNYKTYLE